MVIKMVKKIAFIGVGNMAGAIISGITSRKENPIGWDNIILYDKYSEKCDRYKALGAFVTENAEEAVTLADCIILAVKPQNFPEILPLVKNCPNISNKLFITIAAGIRIKTVSDAVNGAPVVRVLPNTPMLIGKGVSAVCRDKNVSDEDFAFACDIFSSSGKVLLIEEEEMNRIISVTSSSPAYVFTLINAMYEGAVAQGLVSDTSDGIQPKQIIDSICDTIIGSAELMKSQNKTPMEQITTVASKGGTTEKALNELERYKFTEAVISAMEKCTARADELSAES